MTYYEDPETEVYVTDCNDCKAYEHKIESLQQELDKANAKIDRLDELIYELNNEFIERR